MNLGAQTVSITLVETMPKYRDLVSTAMKTFAQSFGGCTADKQHGAWLNADGDLVVEEGTRVWAFVGGNASADSIVANFAQSLADSTGQDAVLYTNTAGEGILATAHAQAAD